MRNAHASNLVCPTHMELYHLRQVRSQPPRSDGPRMVLFKLTGFTAVDTTNTV